MKKLALPGILMLSLGACAAPAQNHSGTPAPAAAVAEVYNNSPHNVDVYMVRGGFAVRIATLPAQASATLQLPRVYLEAPNVAIETRAVATGEVFRSAPMHLGAGDRIALWVLSPLAQSSLAMRVPAR